MSNAGEFISLRGRRWLVEDGTQASIRTQRLTCIDDDAGGEALTVVADAEIGHQALDVDPWASVAASGTDDPQAYRAYVRTLSWRTSTAADRKLFQAPFRAGIRLSAYQLLPLKKALLLPRVNLLIADDVGLGKTIEAGLIVREMLLRGRIDFVLVAAPPSMTIQWQEELEAKFGLSFTIIDREHVASMRRMHWFGVNPWMTGSRFIISHKLLAEESYIAGLRDGILTEFRPRALLILDEAHHAAPASGQRYAVDSQFTKAVDSLAQRFEHRLFLSATPHNGHSNSFSRLLEMLDPQRFTRGVQIKRGELDPVMVRRLKADLIHSGEAFPKRVVEPIELSGLPSTTPELALAVSLAAYGELRDKRLNTLPAQEKAHAKIVFIGLQQRLLSSIKAFARTLEAHRRALQRLIEGSEALAASTTATLDFVLRDPGSEVEAADQDGDTVVEATEARDEAALADAATVSGSGRATRQQLEAEMAAVDKMLVYAKQHQDRPDARVVALVDWIHNNLLVGRKWNNRRLILFTEWEDTRRWLQTQLAQALADTERAEERMAAFTGATSQDRREGVKHAFNRDPTIEPLRILVCTDAAREGINLQMRCADLIHIDLPWNPARIEQRNGRIDRTLQPEPEVRCRYFVYTQRAEDIVLKALVEKTSTIREQLGASGQVLEARITERLARDGIATRDSKRQADLIRDETDAERQRRATDEMDDETAARRKRVEKELAELRTDLEKSRKAVGIDSGELQQVAAIALSRFGVNLSIGQKVQGKNITTFSLDPDHEAFANDPTWALAFDDIRTRRRKKGEKRHVWRRDAPVRALAFEPPIQDDGTDIDDVAQLHLEHRLVRRLLGQFLSYGFQSALNRATVISSSASQPRVVLLGRLTLFGSGAARLHGQIIPVTATWNDADRSQKPLRPQGEKGEDATMRELEAGLTLGRQPSDIIAKRLTATAQLDIADLRSALETRAQEIVTRETAELAKIGVIEAKSLSELLAAQRKRIAEARHDADAAAKTPQLDLFAPDEKRQLDLDRRHWVRKLEQLDRDTKIEPQRIIDSYNVRAHRLEPVGLVYLWPETN
jgi:superfamily II DNA or RNA helicase